MHLEQRGDGNGTGMKLIWRNGRAGDGDPGDHDAKIDPTGIDWRQTGVFHFTVTWHPGGYQVSVGEIQNGTLVGNRIWFAGSFSRAYAPPNHRISIGTRSRSETLEGTYRNFKVYPGPPAADFVIDDLERQEPEMASAAISGFLCTDPRHLPSAMRIRRSSSPVQSNPVSRGCDAKCRSSR